MKKSNQTFEKKENKAKNPTTNYPPSPHKEFCARCYLHNGGCPNTGGVSKDRDCSI